MKEINVLCQKMSDTGFYLLPNNKLYKKENTKRLKNFPAGYVGNFYRNLSDRVDNVQSNFLSAISNDASIPKDDVQKYLLATSDFAKSIQTDINHYVTTRGRINNASFRQKLDPISRNIVQRQNPLELVFEDILTFDSENPIVGSLLREIDIRKKQTDSDFIKSLPSQPGKEFEIKKRLDKLRGTTNNSFNNNNNNVNPGGGGVDISGLGPSPTLPKIEDLIDNGPSLFPPPPPTDGQEVISNVFRPPPPPPPPAGPVLNPFVVPKIDGDGPIGNNIFVSIGAMMGPRSKEKNISDNNEVDDFLYELPDNFPSLELGDKLLDTLGNVGEEVLADTPTKKDEEDSVLQDIIDEYNIPDMKNTMDETGEVPENIYFFLWGRERRFC